MGVAVTLKYLKELGPGRYEYRRRVPEAVKTVLGKNEFKRAFGAKTPAEVARQHALVEVEFQTLIKTAGRPRPKSARQLTPMEAAAAAKREAEELLSGIVGLDDEDDRREVLAENLAQKMGADPVLYRAVVSPGAIPGPTLEDARRLYLKERLRGGQGINRRESEVGLDRVFGRVFEALGDRAGVALVDLKRADARAVRDFLLAAEKKTGAGLLSLGSVQRELGQVKAVISFAIREFDLVGKAVNPFDGLPVEPADPEQAPETEAEKRDPLPPGVIKAVRARLASHGRKREVPLMWRLLEGTGCRVSEVAGLRVEDVVTSSEVPHLKVRWNEDRRLKNIVSTRSVPLVGDALAAAKEALEGAPQQGPLFGTYGTGERGGDAASAALMKHVRAVTKNPRHVTHSLRHNMKDLLIMAQATELEQNLILGHALGGVGNRVYGGEQAKLVATRRVMLRVFGLVGSE